MNIKHIKTYVYLYVYVYKNIVNWVEFTILNFYKLLKYFSCIVLLKILFGFSTLIV